MSQDRAAIVFFHRGRLPKYLLCALESARVFNPHARIFLISDQVCPWDKLKVETVLLEEVLHPGLEEFRQCYRHTSAAKENYERICFERWFYIDQLIINKKLERVLYMDSDCLLFANADELFGHMPEKTLGASRGGGPACTFIRGRINAFLELIVEKFHDEEFLRLKTDELKSSQAVGGMANLTDMTLLEIFTTSHPQGYVYPNNLPSGHIDHCINSPEGMDCLNIVHRKRQRKRVHWTQRESLLLPSFRQEGNGKAVRALAIHYQSGAKRLIRRFNIFEGKSYVPSAMRAKFFQWLHGGPGSQYI